MGGTTGINLEQGLGLTDISRKRPGRRPGDEYSSSPDYDFIIYKINPSFPGLDSSVPGFLGLYMEYGVICFRCGLLIFSKDLVSRKTSNIYFRGTRTRTTAPPRKFF